MGLDLVGLEHLALIERARVVAREADALLAGEPAADASGGVVIELFADEDPWADGAWVDGAWVDGAWVDEPADRSGEASGTYVDGRGTSVGRRLRKFGASGGVLAGMMLGVGEVFEPEKAKATQIEFAPDPADEDSQLVTFHYVKGDPRASRLVIRPWLLERFRRS